MSLSTAALSRSITRASSHQSYLTIAWLADRPLAEAAFRAYAYFRWVDDVVDQGLASQAEGLEFIRRQRDLIRLAFDGERSHTSDPHEAILMDLIGRARTDHPGLRSYLENMMSVMAFDAERRGRVISARELSGYTRALARGVMDALDYFIDHDNPYPASPARELAVAAAHVVHMLRDTLEDVRAGYYNVPREVLEAARITPEDFADAAYQAWVHQRVDLARRWFLAGKDYIAGLRSFRSRLAGFCYSARFEALLGVIERDRFVLQPGYRSPNVFAGTQGLPRLSDWPALILSRRAFTTQME